MTNVKTVVAASILGLWSCGTHGSQEAAAAGSPPLADVALSFKLDPRLSGPTYGGERWVSPPTYTGARGQDAVDVRAEGVEPGGRPRPVAPDWIASDPELVTVSPEHGARVTIQVKGPGESRVTVACAGLSKELVVRARGAGGTMQVEIEQLATVKAAVAAPARKEPTRPALRRGKERLSYVLGMNLARKARSRGVPVDAALVGRGAEDASAGRATLLGEGEARALLSGAAGRTERGKVALRRTGDDATKE